MKKVFTIFLTLVLLSCDDGDITLQSFAFESQTVQKCSDNNLIFKIKDDELLLIDIPESSFVNTVTPDGEPREITVSSSNKIYYRKYSGNLSSTTICSIIPPASPVVKNEWIATGGKILIETNEVFDTDEVTLIGYTHNISFENVSFSGTNDTFSFTTYIFGDYETDL